MRKVWLLPSISPEVQGFPGNPVPRFPGNIPPWYRGSGATRMGVGTMARLVDRVRRAQAHTRQHPDIVEILCLYYLKHL